MAKEKKTSIGGQALIEGIMMRGPHKTVIACRLPDGGISTEEMEWGSASKRFKLLRLPVIRGAVALIDSMMNGYRALMISMERSGMLEEEEAEKERKKNKKKKKSGDEPAEQSAEAPIAVEAAAEAAATTEAEPTAAAEPTAEAESEQQTDAASEAEPTAAAEVQPKSDKKESALELVIGLVSLVFGIGLAVVLFMWLPSKLFNIIDGLVEVNITPYRALFEGFVKILLFVLYMFAVSFMKDIRRTFMYHGAEHKSIFCYEKGLELTVENVREQKRFHPRCGTSFMILMLIVSILLSYLLTLIPGVRWLAQTYSWLWVIIKILILPITCGAGYELIRICGKHDNIVTRAIAAPGVWLQHISTKEPDDSMIEIAIESIKAVIPENSEDDNW